MSADTADPGSAEAGDPGSVEVSDRSPSGLRAAALVILSLGLLVLWRSLAIPPGTGFTVVGPRVFPLAVSAGLLVTGGLFLARVTVWPDRWLIRKAAEEDRMTHWPVPGLIFASLLAYAVALKPLGYVLATALFLPVSARIIGSRNLARDSAVGLVIAVVLFVGFTRFLGIRLPAGLLDPVL